MRHVCRQFFDKTMYELMRRQKFIFVIPLLILASSLLLACGGPPQLADENEEGPARLQLSSDSDSDSDFGESLTSFSYQRTLTLENISLAVSATDITFTSAPQLPFTYAGGIFPGTGGTCLDSLAAQGSCTLVIDLNPTTIGVFQSEISMNYFDGITNQTASFTLATQAREPLPANLVLNPAEDYNYGIVAIGGNSEITFDITNSGELDAAAVAFSGLNTPYSIVNNSCGPTIEAFASCSMTVRFEPGSQATFPDTLNIAYNDGLVPQTINKNFSGEGRVAGFLAIDQGLTFDFGLINSGFNLSQTLTLRNTGGGNATAAAFSGISSPFSVTTNNCPGTIIPGATCTIQVQFAPTTTAVFNSAPNLTYFDGFNNQSQGVQFDGEGFANLLTLTLVNPASPIANNNSPTIRVSNSINNIRIRLYRSAGCNNAVGNQIAVGSSIDFTPTIAEATHQFHARAEDEDGNLSACSVSSVTYEHDATPPNPPSNVQLAANFVTSSTTSPNITWSLSGSSDVVDYQVGISTLATGGNGTSGWTSKGLTNNATQAFTLNECIDYYASVLAEDDATLLSAHATSPTTFRYDSSVPTAPGGLATGGDATDTNSATVSWTASADACGIDHYEVAIGEDTSGNGSLEVGEIGNHLAFTDIGNVLTYRQNGTALNTAVNYYTIVRAVDTTGRVSSQSVSAPWIIYNPSIELPDMIVWLDAQDTSTVLDAEGDNAASGSFSGNVSTWQDKSGSAVTHNFTLSGTTPAYDGVNFSLGFDGLGDGMTTANHAEINTAMVEQRNITVAFQTSGDTATRQVLYDEGGNVRGMNIYIFNNRLYCGFYNTVVGDGDGVQAFTWVDTPITTNSNYFVTWVYDYTNYTTPAGPDGNLTCYLNGASFGTTPTTSRLFGHSGAVGLGHINGQSCFEDSSCPSTGAEFLGNIYEVMLFNNAPDAAAVGNVHTYLDNKWN